MRIPVLLMLAASAAASGCASSIGQSFGLSPPTHSLLPDAKAFRESGPTPPPRELAKTLLPAYVVEPGDGLLIQPVELDAPVRFPADQPVQPDGTIDLGTFGRPIVAGKTAAEIEADVKALVNAKSKEPVAITVRVINRVSKVYYVLGEVNAPGAFPITGRETVLDAVVAAGGLTTRASHANILLNRPTPADGCRIVYPVCYDNIVQLGDTTTNYQVQPGDRIFVPSRSLTEGLLPLPGHKKKCGPCDKGQVPCVGCGPQK